MGVRRCEHADCHGPATYYVIIENVVGETDEWLFCQPHAWSMIRAAEKDLRGTERLMIFGGLDVGAA